MLAFDVPLGFGAEDPARTARRAEELGLDGVWSSEVGHDPYLPLALAAAATERVVLGPAVAVAFPRSPTVHAQAAWDLQRMARGRFILGLGPQVRAHNARRYGVPGDRPAARMRDMIRAIRAVWRCWQEGGRLDHRGEFWTLSLMTPFFNPGPLDAGPPPIYLAAVGEPMLKVAGAECEGVHVHPLHTRRSLADLTIPVARRAAENAGRDPHQLRFVVPVMICTGRTGAEVAEARPAMRAQISFYASTPSYRPVLESEGRGDVADDLHEMSLRGAWGEMPARVDDDLMDAVCVSATWDRLGDALAARYAGLADRIMPYATPDDGTPWAEIAREVRQGTAATS